MPDIDQLKQEQQLIAAIKAKPGYQVHPGRNGNNAVMVYFTHANGVRSYSVWLGRRGTIDRLNEILAA